MFRDSQVENLSKFTGALPYVEEVFNMLSAGDREFHALAGSIEQYCDRVRKGLGVSLRHGQSSFLVFNELWNSSDIGRNARYAKGHGFDQGCRHAVAIAVIANHARRREYGCLLEFATNIMLGQRSDE